MLDKPGSDDAVALAYSSYHDAVFRYLLRRTRSGSDAEDLTQQVFADATPAIRRKRPSSMLAWLYTIADRRFVDDVRRRSRVREVDRAIDAIESLSPSGEDAAAVRGALVQAVSELSAGQQQVVVLKLFRGYSFAEVAVALDVSEPGCRMRFSRAMANLRRALSEQGLGR